MLKTIPALAALGLASLLVLPTVGQAAETMTARVSYADLNLASDAGQGVLAHRIAFAATGLCDVGAIPLDLKLTSATKACRDDAIASAQPAFEAAVNAARKGSVTVLEGAALVITAQ
jgi:UrcA family protein